MKPRLIRHKLTIPEAREVITQAIFRLEAVCVELHVALRALHRQPAKRRAPSTSSRISAKKARLIRAFAESNPDMPLAKIAAAFNVNQGRVSEALNGLR